MLRILIADDHEVVRYGLRKVLQTQPGWDVVAEAVDGKEAINKAAATKPDVAVLDCMMPRLGGVEATQEIRARHPNTEVLIFTAHEDQRLIEQLLRAGARGYLLKSDMTDLLVEAVQSVSEHKPFFTSTVSEALLTSMLTAQMDDGICLSHEEQTLVRLIAEGHTNREVGKILDIRTKDVENRRTAIKRKLKLPSPAAMVLYAIRNGLVEP
jgi:DNA-binding NarL/FixJ family response regulator